MANKVPKIKIGKELAKDIFHGTENHAPIIEPHEHGIYHEKGMSNNDIRDEIAKGNMGVVSSFIRLTPENAVNLNNKTGMNLGLDLSDPSVLKDLKDNPVYLSAEGITENGAGTYSVLTEGHAHGIEESSFIHPSNEDGYAYVKKAIDDELVKQDYLRNRNMMQISRDGWMGLLQNIKSSIFGSHDGSSQNRTEASKLLDKYKGVEGEIVKNSDLLLAQATAADKHLNEMNDILENDATFMEERLPHNSEAFRDVEHAIARKNAAGVKTALSSDEAFVQSYSNHNAAMERTKATERALSDSISNHSDKMTKEVVDYSKDKIMESSAVVSGMEKTISSSEKLKKMEKLKEGMEDLQKKFKELMEKILEFLKKLVGIDSKKENNGEGLEKKPQNANNHSSPQLRPKI